MSNFLLLPLVFVVFSRLDSFFTISTQRNLYASRLFLVSLVPWIDKLWGNTLREKLHEPCACGIQIGKKRCDGTKIFDVANTTKCSSEQRNTTIAGITTHTHTTILNIKRRSSES